VELEAAGLRLQLADLGLEVAQLVVERRRGDPARLLCRIGRAAPDILNRPADGLLNIRPGRLDLALRRIDLLPGRRLLPLKRGEPLFERLDPRLVIALELFNLPPELFCALCARRDGDERERRGADYRGGGTSPEPPQTARFAAPARSRQQA
jgi:hypothetical protein